MSPPWAWLISVFPLGAPRESCKRGLSLHEFFEPLVYLSPVHDVPERLNKLSAVVPVIEVISMLPDVQDHQDPEHWVDVRVVLLNLHDDGTVRLPAEGERRPPRPLGSGRRLRKQLLEPFPGPVLIVDDLSDGAEGFPAPARTRRGKVLPEQRVEYVPPDLERELFECRLRIEIRVVGPSLVHLLENGVGRVHVGRVVLIVVQSQ